MTAPTEDQLALVGLATDVMVGRCSNDQLATVETSETRIDETLWSLLADAGMVGIAVPEAYGGAGLGLTELCLLAEVTGRLVAPVPLLETGLAALAIARSDVAQVAESWLPAVAAGAVLAVAVDLTDAVPSVHADGAALTGSVRQVPFGHVAEALVMAALDSDGLSALWLVETAGLARRPVVQTDHSVAVDLVLSGAPAVRLGGASAVSWLAELLRLGLAAQLLGLADEGIREAASYLSGREQFGRPLATFQATSQQLGDAYCDVQAMRATLWQAVWAVEHAREAAARSTGVATWWATDGAQRVQHTVQHLHGGMGADTTYPVHRRLLRTMTAVARLGGSSRQLVALGREVLTP